VNLGRWLSLLCFIIVLVFLWQIRQVLLLVFTAVVLAIALNSLVRQLQKLGMPRGRAMLLTIGLSLLLTFLFIYLIVPPFIDQFLQLVALVPRGFTRVVTWLEDLLNQRPDWLSNVELPSISGLVRQAQPLIAAVLPNFFAIFSGSLTALLQLLLLLIFTLMLLANPLAYRQALIQLLPAFYRKRADTILDECEVALRSWLGGALISSSVVALLSAIGLWALQIEFVLAQALLAGLLNFIPNIGPTLSMVFPLTVAALDTPWKVLAVTILYIVIQNLESYLITPTIMANQVSLLPAMTLAAQLVFARFFGFLGLLLALPLAVIAKVLIQEVLIKDVLDQWNSNYREPLEIPPEQAVLEHRSKANVFPESDLSGNLFEDPEDQKNSS
jgi:predicted PurR-regulated permease PerM